MIDNQHARARVEDHSETDVHSCARGEGAEGSGSCGDPAPPGAAEKLVSLGFGNGGQDQGEGQRRWGNESIITDFHRDIWSSSSFAVFMGWGLGHRDDDKIG